MRRRNIGLYVVTILIIALTCVISNSEAASKYAAKVNGVKIKNTMLDAAVNNFVENQKMLRVDVKEEDKDKLRQEILDELISAELLYQQAKKADLGDLRKNIDEQFENIKNGFESEQQFKEILKDRGISQKELKKDIKKGVFIKAFLDGKIYNNITVTEEEKRQEYEKNKDKLDVPEQVRASHILINVAPDASKENKAEAKEKIDGLRKRVRSGADFAELAKADSQCPSAAQGGDLGYFKRGDMVKSFEDAAFSLEKGQISDVVETQFGYHIIKVVDKQLARTLSYNEIKDNMERFLLNQRKKEALDKFIKGLREKAKIDIY